MDEGFQVGCGYFVEKRDNIESWAVYDNLLKPRICDSTDLLLSVFHQCKIF